MHVLLETLWLQRGFTTLLITHDVAEAVALADRVVVIKDGRIAFSVDVEISRPRRRADRCLRHCKQKYSTKYNALPGLIE